MPTKSSSASSSSRGVWVVTGQCVCVVHPRIVLTAAHVCFAKRTRHIIRVLHTPVDGKPLQHFEAQLLRYSGVMDLAVLLLDAPVDSSPFQPCFIAPAHNPLFDYLQKVVLFCYPLTMDVQPGASAQRGAAEGIFSRAPSALPLWRHLLHPATKAAVQEDG